MFFKAMHPDHALRRAGCIRNCRDKAGCGTVTVRSKATDFSAGAVVVDG